MKFSRVLLTVAGLVLVVAGLITAQDNGNGRGDTDKDARTMTVTGCLVKNTRVANEYVIKSGEGMSYGLQPGGQDLRLHLGHKVTISGLALKGKGPHDDDRIRVTNLVMISTTCP